MDFFMFLSIYLVSGLLQVQLHATYLFSLDPDWRNTVFGDMSFLCQREKIRQCVKLFNDSYSFFWELAPLVLLIHHLSEDINNQPKCQWQREAQQPTYQQAGIYNLLWKQQWIIGKRVHATTLILSLSCSTILTTINKP